MRRPASALVRLLVAVGIVAAGVGALALFSPDRDDSGCPPRPRSDAAVVGVPVELVLERDEWNRFRGIDFDRWNTWSPIAESDTSWMVDEDRVEGSITLLADGRARFEADGHTVVLGRVSCD